jgi:hypothetical protein
MSLDWAWGCLYLAAYGGWAWLFRSHVDPWARRLVGGRLGTEVIWLPASTFPLELWIWGLSERRGHRFDSRVALGSTGVCLAAAFLPTALLCFVLHWAPGATRQLGHALYLTTVPLVLLFVISHLRRRGADRTRKRDGALDAKAGPVKEME